jgi:hypothetical protein
MWAASIGGRPPSGKLSFAHAALDLSTWHRQARNTSDAGVSGSNERYAPPSPNHDQVFGFKAPPDFEAFRSGEYRPSHCVAETIG